MVILGSGLTVLLLMILGFASFFILRPKVIMRKRMQVLGLTDIKKDGSSKGAGSRQSRIQERLKELEDKGKEKRRRNQIRADILQAGLDTSIRSYILISLGVGIIGTAIALLINMPLFIAGLIGITSAFALPKMTLKFIAGRRRKKFTMHFANSLDVLVRGIKSGLPVGECLAIIGRESPEPVGSEFHLLVEGQKMGFTLDSLLQRGLERMPTSEYKFFAIVLQIQQQTGGNLAETLEGLSNVLRERKKMKDKISAMSSEAKASAAIIASLPFFVAAMVSVLNPSYLMPLFNETVGNYLLFGGFAWMGLGIAVMAKMINFKF